MDDAALVGLARTDPQQGIAGIYDRYGTSLYNYCHSILRSPADAGDALHESFVTVMDKLDQLRDPSKLRPWLYAIARNQCYKRHRQRSRERPEDPFETDEEHVVMAASTTEPGPAQELVSMVWEATAGLSEVDRSVLELNIRHELDGEELAASLGVPGPKCSVMLHRAKDRLKTAVGALIVSKVGIDACGELAGIVTGNEFNPLIRKRVSRHITHCTICEDTERRHRPEAYLAAVPLLPVPASVHKDLLAAIKLGAGTTAGAHAVAATVIMATPASPAGQFEPTVWNADGFPESPTDTGSSARFGSSKAVRIAAILMGCGVALVLLLALFNPFGGETTVIAGPPATQPTAPADPQFLPTEPPLPPTPTGATPPTTPADDDTAPNVDATPTPTVEPTPTAEPPTAVPLPPTAVPPTAVPPTAVPPTPVPPTATPVPSPTPSPTPIPSPTPTPTPSPTPTAEPTPTPTPSDLIAPTIVSFAVTCGDPFVLTVIVDDNIDPDPVVALEATWEDESDPALPLTKVSGTTYRVNVDRSELTGENIPFFVRGTLTDAATNVRNVDLFDDCTIIG